MIRSIRCAAGCVLAVLALAASAEHPNLILRGGRIHTLDAKGTVAGALVIERGRIAYVGDVAGSRAFEQAHSRVLELHGRMVLPGFHDAHAHPMSGGMRLLRCRFAELATELELEGAIRLCAAKVAKGQWVLGAGWSSRMFTQGAPTRARLDKLVPDRPAFITTEDGFSAWINTPAYALAGIDDPPAGPATGELAERVRRRIPPPTQDDYREALRRATRIANSLGVTSIFDAAASEAMLDAYAAADRAGELTVRIVAAQRVDPARGIAQVDAMIERRKALPGTRLRLAAAKVFLDGEIDQHTAFLVSPYADTPGSRGSPYAAQAALDAIVQKVDAAGFSMHVHAMGDGAVRAALDAIERARRANGTRDRRHQIAHLGVVHPEDFGRFAALGVAANFTPIWAHAADEPMAATQAALGPDRSRWIFPMGSLSAAGARITAGSDWPSPSMSPLAQMQVAVTRQPLDGSKPAVQPRERVPLAAILAACTRDAAWAMGLDAISGTIEAGKAADLVVLERDIFDVPAASLHRVRVLATLVDGEPVYRDPGFTWP